MEHNEVKLLELLKHYKAEWHLMNKDIASMLNVSPNTVTNWFNGLPISVKKQREIASMIETVNTDEYNKFISKPESFSPEIKRVSDIMQSWPASLQAKGLSAILEIDEQYQQEKKASSCGDEVAMEHDKHATA